MEIKTTYIFIPENAFENAVCEMADILSRPQCAKFVDFRYISVYIHNDAGMEYNELILGLRPADERCRYQVTPSLIGWAQT